VFAARSGGRRDRGSGGGSIGGGGSRGGAAPRGGGAPPRGGGSRGGQRGGRGAGRIGSMGGGGARPSQPSAVRSVVGSYTVPPQLTSGFSHGGHY